MLLRIRMYNNTYINYDKWLHGSMNEIDETDITKLQHDNYLVRVISNQISLFSWYYSIILELFDYCCGVEPCKLESDKTDTTERQYLFTDSREYKNQSLGNM